MAVELFLEVPFADQNELHGDPLPHELPRNVDQVGEPVPRAKPACRLPGSAVTGRAFALPPGELRALPVDGTLDGRQVAKQATGARLQTDERWAASRRSPRSRGPSGRSLTDSPSG